MSTGYTRDWKFRAWNPVTGKMFSPEDLEEPDTPEDEPKTIMGMLIDGKLVIKDIKTNPPTEYIFMQCTNWYDKEQYEVFEGDIVEVDDKHYQVIWDDETGGYLFFGEDGEITPGGAYLGDFMKIVGNVFENSDMKAEDVKRTITFRAWDPVSKTMYAPEDLKDPEGDMTYSIYAFLSFGGLMICDLRDDPPIDLIPMQDTKWRDKGGKEIFEGDILKVGDEESVAQVSWDDEVGQFVLLANDGTMYPGSAAIVSESDIVGNIYENSDMVPKQ